MVSSWIKRANDYLRERYGVTLEDVGYLEDEFASRWKDQGETPEKAIEAFAEKYDLRGVERW